MSADWKADAALPEEQSRGEGNHKGDSIKRAKCVQNTVVGLLVQILAVVAEEQLVSACSKTLQQLCTLDTGPHI